MNFYFLILVTCCLFVRPSEIVPALSVVPLYELVIIPCIILSLNSLLAQFTSESLRRMPITIYVLGLWFATLLSNLVNSHFDAIVDFGVEFGKVVLFYLLVAGLVNSRARLAKFMTSIVMASFLVTVMALLNYHGIISLEAFEAMEDGGFNDPVTGEPVIYRRLCGPGFFHDPNDVSLIHAVGIMLSLCGLGDKRRGVLRFSWLVPIPVFGYAFMLTHSRGGFIALMSGVLALFVTRFGAKRAAVLITALLPLVFVVFAGRQLKIDTSEGTAQSRIQIWTDGLMLFRQSPLFGIGPNQYGEHVGHVAHNSYIHAYTELGVFGGALFVGIVSYALWTIYRLVREPASNADPEVTRMGPYVLGALSSYAAGMLTLSENYLVTTFAMFGLASTYIRLASPGRPFPGLYLDQRLAVHLVLVGMGTIAILYVFATRYVNWG